MPPLPNDPLNRRRWAALALLFVASFALFLGLLVRFPVLYDADSYFQLAVARHYAEEGLRGGLPWARFSVLADGFGDKDVLFHLLLVPFATWMDPLLGGRIAVALLNAALVTALAAGALRVAGGWAFVVPLWVYVGAMPLFFRLHRLRPEGFALLLLLLAAWLAVRGRYRWLGVVAFLFALSYTAIHALVGLCLLWLLAERWRSGRWSPPLLLYPLLGAGLGLVAHPQFPANVNVWVHVNLLLPLYGARLDVGSEYGALSTRELLLHHLGWWVGLAVIWLAADKRGEAAAGGSEGEERRSRAALFLGIAALAFGALYLLVGRFATFFLPFATLAFFAEIDRRGRRIGRWTRLPRGRRLPFAVGLAVAVLLGVPETARTVGRLLGRQGEGVPLEVDRRAFGAAVPDGAKVAATWGSAEWFTFFAPQGRYLNVLDPIFMAVPYPEEHAVLGAVFGNREPDVPLVVKTRLDSDFIAINRYESPPALVERLVADPRVRLRYGGAHLLAEIVPGAHREFVLDWRVLPASAALPPQAEAVAGAPAYPRWDSGPAALYEGYVDGRRLGPPRGCVAFARRFSAAADERVRWEFAPAGPSRLWLDGEPRVQSLEGTGAALGSGLVLEERLAAGEHTLTVESCASEGPSAQLGFYLLRRAT